MMKTHIISTIVLSSVLINLSVQYQHYNIEDDDLCSPIKRRKITLGKAANSGLIVKQTRLNDHSTPWLYNNQCQFKVQAPKHGGVAAVIQHLSLRKNETNEDCIDYLQFKAKNGETSKQFCGSFNAAVYMDPLFLNPGAAGVSNGNAFVDSAGDMEVTLFVTKTPLKLEESMDLAIVFTAYYDCADLFRRYRDEDHNDFKPCGSKLDKFCIFEGFFNDGVVNCPLANCIDELGCSKKDVTEPTTKTTLGNKVLIGSISSLFVLFIIFIVCLWICRAYRALCWSDSCANPNRRAARPPTPEPTAPPPSARVIEMSESTGLRRLEVPQRTTARVTTIDPDKDMPPSYDSLFPDR